MTKKTSIASALLLVSAAAGVAAAASVSEVPGDCAEVFAGEVCTWARMNGTTLVEAGATIPLAAIESAPADAPMVWPPVPVASIDMPEAVREQTGLVRLSVDWMAGGHPPATFMTPHFDFHFYTVTQKEVAGIDCADETKPATVPAGYDLPDVQLPPEMAEMLGVSTLVGLCVPEMGMHAVPAGDVDRQDPFDGSMLIGYYAGAPIFIEPMISKATLMKAESFDLPMPAVEGLTGLRPTRFRAEYDPARKAYRFILSAFTPAAVTTVACLGRGGGGDSSSSASTRRRTR